jgi:large conductance mechanosensitive channel
MISQLSKFLQSSDIPIDLAVIIRLRYAKTVSFFALIINILPIFKIKTMGFIQEFKAFALKGNVLDLAVGVIIGGAFGKIVTALVDHVLMPVINMAGGGDASFKELKIGAIEIGAFLQATIDFLIIAFILFLVIRFVNRFKRSEPAPPPAPPAPNRTEVLLEEILAALKK